MAETIPPIELTAKQRKVIAVLLSAGTVRGASQLAKVSERQIFRWLGEDAFTNALREASDEALAATVRALSDAATLAVLTLRSIMTKPGAKDSDKRGAADSLLGHMLKVREIADIERRLSELEKAQDAKP